MLLWQALFLGALQGVSELFPVSSLAQTILLPALLGWHLPPRQAPDFLAFLVMLHLATATALLIYFWKDWKIVVGGFFGALRRKRLICDDASKFAWLLISGTVVVGAVGLVFEKKLHILFDDPKKAWIVGVLLAVNGLGMLLADMLKLRSGEMEKRRELAAPPLGNPVERQTAGNAELAVMGDADPAEDPPTQRRRAEDLTLLEGAAVGASQSLALLPGLSRSGVSIAAGLLAGLSYEQACRFAFMLATPVIGAAALREVPTLFKHQSHEMLRLAIPAAIVAGICAYLSTRFLMRYFRHHRLGPFGWYCILFGIFSVVMLRH